ncbi:MAG TPA: hypothetical protein VFT50_01880 [Baekduia sp.]|nr:hypothetical protein [Baekduia sp.]
MASAMADPDGDGLTNWTEYRAHTSPKQLDSDRDGIDDDAEDRDRDGLDNASEQRSGSDPARRDSDRDGRADAREDADGDGLPNGAEQATANDPADADSDDDGVADGAEGAGQVVSFAGGVLTLRLAATGELVTAPLADDAWIGCDGVADYEADFADGTSDDPADDEDSDEEEDGVAGGSAAPRAAHGHGHRVVAMAAVIRGGDDGYSDDGEDLDLPYVDDDAGEPDDGACGTDALVSGMWVHEAELGDAGAGRRFETVLLVDRG